MNGKWTDAAELARLAGLSRQRLSQLLARGDIPEAVRVAIGERTAWRIPVATANAWLGDRKPAKWVKAEVRTGRWNGAVWVGA